MTLYTVDRAPAYRAEVPARGRFPAEPAVGVVVQLILLVLLATTAGLGPVGWLAGTAYGVTVGTVLTVALCRRGRRSLGPADRVTLARAILTGGVTALVADSVRTPPPLALLITISALALSLDAVDGRVARRTGTVSALGARFDMEVDAFLILVLSVFVAPRFGAWVLAIGGMRYAFAAAGRVLPWLRGPLPPSLARKTVAALQGIALTVAASGVLPHLLGMLTTVLSLATLVWSFTRDVTWLYRHRAPAVTGVVSGRARAR